MTRAIAPKEIPPTPEDYTGWDRSTRRAGTMFHLHELGFSACGKITLDRYRCEAPKGLGDFQYWGACPVCFDISQREPSK